MINTFARSALAQRLLCPLTFRPQSAIVRHGSLGGRFLLADFFMPLSETLAVKHKSNQ